jgi:CDP-glycerol:poly(glycerophosphate) glycerophosphotransferase
MVKAPPLVLRAIRAADAYVGRRSSERRILVDARTAVNYTMVSPVIRALESDPRFRFYFTASEEPQRIRSIYREAPHIRLVHPRVAAFMKFDAYIASDFMWATLPRGTRRVQVFHGVGGKYGFDAPDRSMREWHRLFFVNERRLRNFISSGAIDADSDAIRLIGMPKVDCLVNGTMDRSSILRSLDLDPSRPTVLYAPTWSPASSLNAMGEDLIRALIEMPINVIVKLHDRSRDLRERYSGGIDWVARLEPLLPNGRGRIAPGHDISSYLASADLMITDHSSAGFEFLLRDKPIVRIHRPELIKLANIHSDYVELLASVADSVNSVREAKISVERGLSTPSLHSRTRRAVAADLFYRPGGATRRSVEALCELLELEPVPLHAGASEVQCQQSA